MTLLVVVHGTLVLLCHSKINPARTCWRLPISYFGALARGVRRRAGRVGILAATSRSCEGAALEQGKRIMDVILLERIEKLGQMGDVVAVKPGFARNYLLPRKKALRATEANRAVFDQQRAQLEAENLKHREEAERVARDMDGMTVIIVRQASDSDQLYGSVTPRDIASGITEAGVTADRRQIKLDQPIKTVGMHPVRVDLHPEVSVEVIANVARTQEEAEMQARGERINRDGDVVDIEEDDAVEVEAVFEEGAAPGAEELSVSEDDAAPEADAPAEETGAGDAAPSEEDPEKTEG